MSRRRCCPGKMCMRPDADRRAGREIAGGNGNLLDYNLARTSQMLNRCTFEGTREVNA